MSITMESISIQDRSKYLPIETTFKEAITAYNSRGLSAHVINDLEIQLGKQIKEAFNLNVSIILGAGSSEAYVLVQPVNVRHVFTPSEYKVNLDTNVSNVNSSHLDMALKAGKAGTVDLHNARVGGIFSEIEVFVYVDVAKLIRLSINEPDELTGILLHEIGHAITYFIFCAATASINRVLMSYVYESMDTRTYQKQIAFTLKDSPALTDADLHSLATTNNRMVFSWKLSKLIYKHHAAHSTHSIYDNSAAESLADNFATRCGYGKGLVTALVKLYATDIKKPLAKLYTESIADSSLALDAKQSTKTFSLFNPITWVLRGVEGIFQAFSAISLGTTHITTVLGITEGANDLAGDKPSLRYDTMVGRIVRVRQQVISALRTETNKRKVAVILNELAEIERHVPDKDNFTKLEPTMRSLLSLLNSGERDTINFEQALARLLSNELIVSSSRAMQTLENGK